MASRVDELKKVPLFSGLSQRQLRQLARAVNEREYRPGVTVVRQGKMSGIGFFIVVEGRAAVIVDDQEVAQIGPSDHFGELALISDQVRSATVSAVTPTRCLVMASWDFKKFATENPDVSWKLLQYLVGLLTEERTRRVAAALQAS